MRVDHGNERGWAIGLIVAGAAVLVVVAAFAVGIVRDPGDHYDRWVPDDTANGPEAAYDWSSDGLLVTFEDTSDAGDAPIERRVWDFGDDVTSDEPAPTHRFDGPGEWDVTLDVVDESGMDSQATGTVEIENGESKQGNGEIGLNDVADKVIDTLERSSKGGLVVVLVVAMLLVLALIGGRLIHHGVRLMRPVPDRISLKLRPKELELSVAERIEGPVGEFSEVDNDAATRELITH